MFDNAKKVIQEYGKASIPLLQRKLKIGGNKATKLLEEVEEIWNNSCEYSIDDEKTLILNSVITKQSEIYNGIDLPNYNSTLSGKDLKKYSLQNFGKTNEKYQSVFTKEFRNDLLYLVSSDKNVEIDKNNTLSKSVKNCPILFLEYLRINSIIPIYQKIDDRQELNSLVKEIENDFSFLKKSSGKIISSIAVILGVDAAVDGTIDTIPNLIKALGFSGLAIEISKYINAFLLAGFMFSVINNQLNKSQLKDFNLGLEVINNIAEQVKLNSISEFNKYMNFWRELISQRIMDRYHIQEESTRIIRLLQCVSDFENTRKNILEIITQSPHYVFI